MRKLLICLLVLLSFTLPTARADMKPTHGVMNLPDAIAQYLVESDRWSSYEITGWANPDGQSDGFVALYKKGDNELLCFRLKDGAWQYAWHNDDALPDNDMPFILEDATGSRDAITDQVHDQPRLWSYYVLDGELYDFSCGWDKQSDGAWLLTHYTMYQPMELSVHVKAKSLAFYFTDAQKDPDVVEGIVERNLRYINADTLPTSIEEAEKKLSLPPEIPMGELEAERIKFTGGKKYKVYQGPGEYFGQAGNGKAVVSTNDWIQVFGREGEWIMIQYDISSTKMRIGWIKADALPKNAQVKQLDFTNQHAQVTVDGASVTDDPLFSQVSIALLPVNTQVSVLSTMGEWSYVQVYGEMARFGFMKSSMLDVESAQDRARRQGSNALTEVYGYSQEEVDARFAFNYAISGQEFIIHMFPTDHPDWQYEAVFHLGTGKHIRSTTPFGTDYADYPGEGTFRYTMDKAIAEGWLYNWRWEDRGLLRQWMLDWSQPITDTLAKGLDDGELSPMQAVTEIFLGSYGPKETWPQPLTEWHDQIIRDVEENYQGNG
ncbi:MAG: hypothetical protein J6K13_03600 [Clostridia bacterium]|nr:hypothetical protein [Clostridia bacterium]